MVDHFWAVQNTHWDSRTKISRYFNFFYPAHPTSSLQVTKFYLRYLCHRGRLRLHAWQNTLRGASDTSEPLQGIKDTPIPGSLSSFWWLWYVMWLLFDSYTHYACLKILSCYTSWLAVVASFYWLALLLFCLYDYYYSTYDHNSLHIHYHFCHHEQLLSFLSVLPAASSQPSKTTTSISSISTSLFVHSCCHYSYCVCFLSTYFYHDDNDYDHYCCY